MSASPRGIANKLPRSVLAATLVVSLMFSAALTAAVLRSPNYHWLAWFSFLPLFVAVRWLGCPVPSRGAGRNRPMRRSWDSSSFRTLRAGGIPVAAALAGGAWGAFLYLFSTAGSIPTAAALAPAIGPSAWLLALFIVIPAVYVGLAARPARAIGFKFLTLALGWLLIEAVIGLHHPSGAHAVLITDSVGETSRLYWLVRLLGYVLAAFLVACANASLIGLLSRVRLCFPARRTSAGSPNAGAWAPSQIVLAIQSWPLRQAYPRAPPIQVVAPN